MAPGVPTKDAVATAPLPPPPLIATVGTELYRLPGLVTVIAVTTPPTTVAVAVAPLPVPLIVTVGVVV
jgi:hypothetical protein